MIFFLFLIETICCDPSSERSRRDGSDEVSHRIFLCRINKKTLIITKYSHLSRALIFFEIFLFSQDMGHPLQGTGRNTPSITQRRSPDPPTLKTPDPRREQYDVDMTLTF